MPDILRDRPSTPPLRGRSFDQTPKREIIHDVLASFQVVFQAVKFTPQLVVSEIELDPDQLEVPVPRPKAVAPKSTTQKCH
jgi:hypothetical protein